LRSIAEFPSPDGAVAADVNADKKINSTDLALMKKYILLIIDKFPAEDSQTPDEDNPGILYNGRFDFQIRTVRNAPGPAAMLS